jgi:hypothetical protein
MFGDIGQLELKINGETWSLSIGKVPLKAVLTKLGMKEGSGYRSKKLSSKSRRKGRKGIHPKTLSGLEYSSKELPYYSPVVKIIEE